MERHLYTCVLISYFWIRLHCHVSVIRQLLSLDMVKVGNQDFGFHGALFCVAVTGLVTWARNLR